MSNFLCFASFICPAIAAVNKEKSQISLKFSTGPSHPISEIANSHVCGLKRLKTRVIKICMFFYNQESEGAVSYILGVRWFSGSGEVGGHGPSYSILCYVIYSKIYCFD